MACNFIPTSDYQTFADACEGFELRGKQSAFVLLELVRGNLQNFKNDLVYPEVSVDEDEEGTSGEDAVFASWHSPACSAVLKISVEGSLSDYATASLCISEGAEYRHTYETVLILKHVFGYQNQVGSDLLWKTLGDFGAL